MALTVTPVRGATAVWGNKRARPVSITFDSSYVTGGEPITLTQIGLKGVGQVLSHGPFRNAAGTASIMVSYDHANQKLLAYQGATEVSNATDLSAYTGRITFVGA